MEVNPEGYEWRSLVTVGEASEMKKRFDAWRDKPNQAGTGDGVAREACDPW